MSRGLYGRSCRLLVHRWFAYDTRGSCLLIWCLGTSERKCVELARCGRQPDGVTGHGDWAGHHGSSVDRGERGSFHARFLGIFRGNRRDADFCCWRILGELRRFRRHSPGTHRHQCCYRCDYLGAHLVRISPDTLAEQCNDSCRRRTRALDLQRKTRHLKSCRRQRSEIGEAFNLRISEIALVRLPENSGLLFL